jgi:hypothetical protein
MRRERQARRVSLSNKAELGKAAFGKVKAGGAARLFVDPHGETVMGDRGSKDKGKKEAQKKAQLSPKEKRKLKREKKDK